MHQQKCIINLLLHTLLFCNWVCFAGATYDALYPYSDKETWGGKMKIEDIRRRLNNIDVGNGVTPLNNTFNSIDIANVIKLSGELCMEFIGKWNRFR